MKQIALIIAGLIISFYSFGQANAEKPMNEQYEMKTYYMVFLKKGPNRTHTEKEVEEIQKNHLAHITKLHKEGKVAMAGPFTDDGEIRGILVFNVANADEVKKMAEEDPAVKAGRLIVEVHPWYSAKGTTLP